MPWLMEVDDQWESYVSLSHRQINALHVDRGQHSNMKQDDWYICATQDQVIQSDV